MCRGGELTGNGQSMILFCSGVQLDSAVTGHKQSLHGISALKSIILRIVGQLFDYLSLVCPYVIFHPLVVRVEGTSSVWWIKY